MSTPATPEQAWETALGGPDAAIAAEAATKALQHYAQVSGALPGENVVAWLQVMLDRANYAASKCVLRARVTVETP